MDASSAETQWFNESLFWFCATTFGNKDDNPVKPDTLTDEQKARAVMVWSQS